MALVWKCEKTRFLQNWQLSNVCNSETVGLTIKTHQSKFKVLVKSCHMRPPKSVYVFLDGFYSHLKMSNFVNFCLHSNCSQKCALNLRVLKIVFQKLDAIAKKTQLPKLKLVNLAPRYSLLKIGQKRPILGLLRARSWALGHLRGWDSQETLASLSTKTY